MKYPVKNVLKRYHKKPKGLKSPSKSFGETWGRANRAKGCNAIDYTGKIMMKYLAISYAQIIPSDDLSVKVKVLFLKSLVTKLTIKKNDSYGWSS